jgi:hypothetical protein
MCQLKYVKLILFVRKRPILLKSDELYPVRWCFSHSFRIKLLECSVLQCCHHLECSVLQCCHHLCSRLFCVRDLNCCDSTILYDQEPKGKSERDNIVCPRTKRQVRKRKEKSNQDGWKGDPWALSLASGQINCCWMSKNQLVKYLFIPESRCPTSMAPKPLLLNHPNSLDTPTK